LVVRTVKSYRDLLVWQKSMVLAESCYQITNGFTRDDQQVLGQEIRRSSWPCASGSSMQIGHGQSSKLPKKLGGC